jgi:uroporphyrinogen-III synthase
MAAYQILSTRKIDPLLIKQAKQNNIEIVEKEFISVKPILTKEKAAEILAWANAGKEYIAFTSANAVAPFDYYLHPYDTYYVVNWKIFCLAGKTKEAVLNSRTLEKNIVDTATHAKALAQKIVEHDVKELLFFCGTKRREELPTFLKAHNVTVHEVTVYETLEVPTVHTKKIDGILFFSPSAVSSFFSVNKLDRKTICFAIGETTAAAIADFTDNKVITSEVPSPEMVIASVQFYFQNKTCYE